MFNNSAKATRIAAMFASSIALITIDSSKVLAESWDTIEGLSKESFSIIQAVMHNGSFMPLFILGGFAYSFLVAISWVLRKIHGETLQPKDFGLSLIYLIPIIFVPLNQSRIILASLIYIGIWSAKFH